ncbi:MAG: 1-acyl-sn-glycerol-3-phosphate acyltransferase [Oscillospiraceae bacterium]|jgi:1-acyl-sn-glycerol-3-phosphate acyltransferase|nr:1-acyl-sn-glycerol-3-phosphate acyltransferase [Oscillospiraceae bacterium]
MGKQVKYNYNKKIKSKGISYYFWLPLARFLPHIKFRRVIRCGTENIPKEGGIILASNHISGFDPITVGGSGGRDLHFMSKIEHFENWYSPLLRVFNGFPVNRGNTDKSSVEYAIRVVKEGHVLGMFPEGTRSKTFEKPVKGKSGVALIAREARADVLPISLYKVQRDKKWSDLIVRYGEVIKYEDFGFTDEKKSRELKDATKKIMGEIGKLWEQGDAKL